MKNDYFAVTQHIKIKGNRIHFPKLMDGIYFRGSKDKLAGIKDINQIIIPKDSGSYKYISKKALTFREEMNCEMFILLEAFKIVYETPL